jgi:hypothetical protein
MAFYSCSGLTSITIPKSVTDIGERAFNYCESLTSINVDEDNAHYKSIDGNLFSKDGETLIQYLMAKTDKSFVVPENVTKIECYAFAYCTALESVTIPDGVTVIDEHTFYGCYNLVNVTIPKSVLVIGWNAFYACNELKTVYYTGSSAEWAAIKIDSNNEPLTSADIICDYLPEE